jgi:hypothetical protein
MPTHPAAQALLVLTVLTCAFALWKGGLPERIAMAIIVANVAAGVVQALLVPGNPGIAGLVVDAATAFGFLALTLRYGLPWLGVAMLIFSLQFGLHAFYLVVGRSPQDLLHATINNLNFLGTLVCLGVGTIGAIRRRQAAPAGG